MDYSTSINEIKRKVTKNRTSRTNNEAHDLFVSVRDMKLSMRYFEDEIRKYFPNSLKGISVVYARVKEFMNSFLFL